MKRLIIAMLIACASLPASAATFKSVKEVHPIYGSDFTPGWSYEFHWTSPASTSPEAIVHTYEENCASPKTPDGRPLFPPPRKGCFDTEALARVEAQKEADGYEMKERQLGVRTADNARGH
jgi:hypothetical protein